MQFPIILYLVMFFYVVVEFNLPHNRNYFVSRSKQSSAHIQPNIIRPDEFSSVCLDYFLFIWYLASIPEESVLKATYEFGK